MLGIGSMVYIAMKYGAVGILLIAPPSERVIALENGVTISWEGMFSLGSASAAGADRRGGGPQHTQLLPSDVVSAKIVHALEGMETRQTKVELKPERKCVHRNPSTADC